MKRRVITAVLGATSGMTVCIFGPEGVSYEKHDIPWKLQMAPGKREVIIWPIEWLRRMLSHIQSQAKPGDIIAIGTWGADSALVREDLENWTEPILHYLCVPQSFLDAALAHTTAEKAYLASGGANVAPFQLYSQLMLQRELLGAELDDVTAIVPMGDMMTFWLSGQKRHNPVQLQSYGLLAPDWQDNYIQPFGRTLVDRIRPWPVFDEDALLETDKGYLVMPAGHDSIFSRMVGFSESLYNDWTGTWVGTAIDARNLLPRRDRDSSEPIVPSRRTYHAKIAFEGGAAIHNIARINYYRALVELADIKTNGKLDYRATAEAAAKVIDKVSYFNICEMPDAKDPHVGRDWLMEKFGDPISALAAVIKATAEETWSNLNANGVILDVNEIEEVSVTGGWSENHTYLDELQKKRGLKRVLVPPHANNATAAGLAAEALRRVGDASTFKEALALLPTE